VLNGFEYEHWLATARRCARRQDEAADLLHDSLIEAIRVGRTDFANESNRRWFTGVLKNRAKVDARSASRRTRREQARATRDHVVTEGTTPPKEFIESLPRSARAVAVLALSGMRREEIVSALNLAPTAFRQRLSTIRCAWENLPDDQRPSIFEDAPTHPRPDPEFELGLIRRALLAAVKWSQGLGVHDPDGHLIVIDRHPSSQTGRARQRKGSKENSK
jgi:RNA polymerase sigma-70 factor (ECF subfamily)